MNLCQLCADKIADLHQFYVMYMESHRKLNDVRKIVHRIHSSYQLVNESKLPTPQVSSAVNAPIRFETRSKHEATAWECYQCHLSTATIDDLILHSQICVPVRHAIEFVSIDGVVESLEPAVPSNSNRERTSSGPVCRSIGFRKKNLNRPMRTDQDEENHLEEIENSQPLHSCLAIDVAQQVTNQHNAEYNIPDGIYQCDLCHASPFEKLTLLQKHLFAAHAEDRPYTCKVCSKRFKTIGRLDNHRRTHDKELLKNFICTRCNRSFHSATALSSHSNKIHFGHENSHECHSIDNQMIFNTNQLND